MERVVRGFGQRCAYNLCVRLKKDCNSCEIVAFSIHITPQIWLLMGKQVIKIESALFLMVRLVIICSVL